MSKRLCLRVICDNSLSIFEGGKGRLWVYLYIVVVTVVGGDTLYAQMNHFFLLKVVQREVFGYVGLGHQSTEGT